MHTNTNCVEETVKPHLTGAAICLCGVISLAGKATIGIRGEIH